MKRILFSLTVIFISTLTAFSQTAGSSPCSAINLYPGSTCNDNCGAQYCGYYSSETGSAANTPMVGTTTLNPGCTADNESTQAVEWLAVTATATSFSITNETSYVGGGASIAEKRDYIIYSGPCGSLTQIACFSENLSGAVNTVTGLTVGQTYYIMVSQSSTALTQCATCTLTATCITSSVPFNPPNNACSGAISLSNNVPYVATNANSTADGPSVCESPGSGSVENNVWYSWCAPSTWPVGQTAYLNVNSQVCNSTQGLQLSVFAANTPCSAITAGTATSVICANPGVTTNYSYTFTPTANSCYLINLDGFAGTSCTFLIMVGTSTVVCAPPTITLSGNTSICSPGSTTLTASGATTYTWSPATGLSTTSGSVVVASPTVTTTYNVTGTSAGCSGGSSITVTVTPTPVATATPSSQTICSGTATSISLSSSVGGSTFSWTSSQSGVTGASSGSGSTITQTLTTTGASAGTATYTITPTAGVCAGAPIVVTVTVNPVPTLTVTPTSQTFCSGGATSIVLTSSVGGSTFAWTVTQTGVSGASASSGSTITQTLTTTGASSGTVTYTITPSANSCAGTPVIATITVNPIPVVTATPSSQTICSGTATSISLSSTVAGSTFSWTSSQSGVSGASSGSGSSITQTLTTTGASAGTATYTITPSANSCAVVPTVVTVTVDPVPVVTATPSSQTFCSGGVTSISLSSTVGGSTFSWTATQTGVTGASASSGSSITQTLTTTGASAGTVTYTITPTAGSCNGLPIVASVTVNPVDIATFTYPSSTYCQTGTNPSPTITGTPGGIFSSAPAGLVFVSTATGAINLSGSALGTYTITYSTSGPCPNSGTFNITITNAPSATFSYSGTPFCQSAANPNPTFGGGSSAGTFSATPAGLVFVNVNTGQIDIATSTPGTYTVTNSIAAAGGCSSASSTFTVTIDPAATVNAGTNQTICGSSPITLSGSFGGSASNVTWTTSGSGTFGSTTSAVTTYTPSAGDVTSGTVTFTLTTNDPAGACNAVSSQFTLTLNADPIVNAGISQSLCTGGSVTLTASGATTYTWTGGVTNGTPFTPGSSGSYTVTGTDANGCTNSDSLTITVNPIPVVSAGADQSVCTGSPVTLNGSGAITYTWTGGVINGTPFTPVSSGSYTVTGTDANGCTNSDSVNVTVNAVPTLTITAAPGSICAGQTTTLTANGATTYTWSANAGGVSAATVTVSPAISDTYTVTGDASGCIATQVITVNVNTLPTVNGGSDQTICAGALITLNGSGALSYTWTGGVTNGAPFSPGSSGSYTVTGADANGCTNVDTVNITVNSLPVVSGGPDQAFCIGGSATLSGSGALSYTWTGGVSNGVPFTPASSGSYTVLGTDANGCVNSDTVNVIVNALPAVSAGADQAVCSGNPVTLNGSGAVTYTWTGGVTNGTPFTPVSSGSYTVSGTDANGCTNTDSVNITLNPLPIINAGVDQTICAGASVTLSGSGGLIYVWTGGVVNGAPFTPASSGSYTVAGIDINGCSNTDVVNITVNSLPTVSAGADQAFCVGGSATLNGSGALTYTWTGGITNGVPFTPGATGSYTVTGTDANGCTNTDSVNVIVNNLPNVTAGADQTICAGVSITLSGGGATTYTWSGSVTDGTSFTPATSGTYTVVGTDINGCVNTDVVNVTVNSLPIVTAGADQSACAGSSITLTGGGATTYTWTGGVINGTPFTPVGSNSYTVTGTDINGCTNTDVVNVTVNPLPTVNAGGSVVMPCGATSYTLNGTSNATTPVYNWNGTGIVSGGNTSSPVINATGIYTLTVVDNATGCSDTATVNVTSINLTVGFTPDVTSGFSPVGVNFTNTSINSTGYNWVFGNGSTSTATNPSSTFTTPGTYTVLLIGTNGSCIDTAFALITVLENSSITAPNIFSPNGDNINDLYSFTTVGIQQLSADIYNRWGEIVGKIGNVNDGWDGKTLNGKNASEGTYFYILTATGYDNKKYELHGSFTLVK